MYLIRINFNNNKPKVYVYKIEIHFTIIFLSRLYEYFYAFIYIAPYYIKTKRLNQPL